MSLFSHFDPLEERAPQKKRRPPVPAETGRPAFRHGPTPGEAETFDWQAAREKEPEVAHPGEAADRLRFDWQRNRHPAPAQQTLTNPIGAHKPNDRLDVAKLETALHDLGAFGLFRTAGPTGYFGGLTDEAIRDTQSALGVKVDGVVNPDGETWRAIRGALGRPMPKPDPYAAYTDGPFRKAIALEPDFGAPTPPSIGPIGRAGPAPGGSTARLLSAGAGGTGGGAPAGLPAHGGTSGVIGRRFVQNARGEADASHVPVPVPSAQRAGGSDAATDPAPSNTPVRDALTRVADGAGEVWDAVDDRVRESTAADPLGFDGPNALTRLPVVGPAMEQTVRSLDAVGRAMDAVPHAVVQFGEEVGGQSGKRLARDLVSMPGAFAGQGPGAIDNALTRASTMTKEGLKAGVRQAPFAALEPIDRFLSTSHQLERLIEIGGRKVKVWQLTSGQLDDIAKVVPDAAAHAFRASDGKIYATERLRDSLMAARTKHSERLIRRMPELAEHGQIRGNTPRASQDRPTMSLGGPEGSDLRPKSDVMVLDAHGRRVGVPTIMTTPTRSVEKWRKP